MCGCMMEKHTTTTEVLGVELLRARAVDGLDGWGLWGDAAPRTMCVPLTPLRYFCCCARILFVSNTTEPRHAAMGTQITRTCTVLVCGAYIIFGPRSRPRDHHDRVWCKRGAGGLGLRCECERRGRKKKKMQMQHRT